MNDIYNTRTQTVLTDLLELLEKHDIRIEMKSDRYGITDILISSDENEDSKTESESVCVYVEFSEVLDAGVVKDMLGVVEEW